VQWDRGTVVQTVRRALEEYGCRNVGGEENVEASLGGREILFEQAEGGTFEGLFTGIDEAAAESFVSDVEREYTRLLQARTYERVLAGAAEHGYTVESEHVEDDNSLVVTLRVPDA
jgi:hypothetical protein